MSIVGVKKNHIKKGVQAIYLKYDPIYGLLELEWFSLSSFMIQRKPNSFLVNKNSRNTIVNKKNSNIIIYPKKFASWFTSIKDL